MSRLRNVPFPFLQRAQCSHCKRCISYSDSVRPSVRLSVCLSVCLSVTRRYCVKTTAHSTVQFATLDSKMCLVCRNQKIFPRDDPFPLKFWLKVTYPLLKAASFDTFCVVAPQPYEIEKEVQLRVTRTRQGLSNEPSTKVLRRP